MKGSRKKLTTGILITVLCFIISGAYSSGMGVPQFIERKIEPISELVKDQPVKFRLEYNIGPQFLNLAGEEGSVTIYLSPFRDDNDILAKYEWPIHYEKSYSHSLEFDLVIPDNNVYTLHYRIICGKAIQDGTYFFNTVDEKIEFTNAIGTPPMPRDRQSKVTSFVPLDHLTSEQKKKVFKFVVDLSDPSIKKYTESLIGSISKENLINAHSKSYLIEATLEDAIKIGKKGTIIDFINRPRWKFNGDKQEYDLIQDTTTSIETPQLNFNKPDEKETMAPPGISIDSVSPLTAAGNIPTGELVTFYLHVQNDTFQQIIATQNGFRIYSPDGAHWTEVSTDTLPSGWKDMFDLVLLSTYSNDGQDADTVAFGCAIFSATTSGMPWNFDEDAWTITIGPVDASMDGKTICIDSSFFDQAGRWLWTDETATNYYYPAWSGEECYEIESPSTVKYSGYLSYTDPVPPGTTYPTIEGVRVEMRDVDLLYTEELAVDTTDEFGYFELGPVVNEEPIIGTRQDVILRFKAENEHAYITDEVNGDIYVYESPEVSDIPSGNYDTTIVIPVGAPGAFYILDVATKANEKWQALSSIKLPKVQIASDDNNIGSRYYYSQDCIYIEAIRNDSLHYPDYYDKDVILHEYGHHIEDIYEFFNSWDTRSHKWYSEISDTLAACEGFAHFYANICNDSPYRSNYDYSFTHDSWSNSETGILGYHNIGQNNIDLVSANDWGKDCEGAVAGILWDIYDADIDDQSTYPPASSYPNLSDSPDGIADELHDGAANIMDVLL